MKKIYKFEENDQAYLIFLEGLEKFKINKDNLKVDGTKFYEAFFDKYSAGDVLELQKGDTVDINNKLSIAVYDTMNQLINEITQKIDEQKEE